MIHGSSPPDRAVARRRIIRRLGQRFAVAACLISGSWSSSALVQAQGTGQLLEVAAQTVLVPNVPDMFSPLPAALAALRQTITLDYRNETPIRTVLLEISNATRTEPHRLLRDGLQFYLDPISLAQRMHQSDNPPVTLACLDLHIATVVQGLAAQLGMIAYIQRDGVILLMTDLELRKIAQRHQLAISDWFLRPYTGGFVPPQNPQETRAMARLRIRLGGQAPIPFSNATPLEVFVRSITDGPATQGADGPLAVEWDTSALQALKPRGGPSAAMIRLKIGSVPFRTSLALGLHQHQLCHRFGVDGKIIVMQHQH